MKMLPFYDKSEHKQIPKDCEISAWVDLMELWGEGESMEERSSRTLKTQRKIKSLGCAWLTSLQVCDLSLPPPFFRAPLPGGSAYNALPGQAGSQEAADGKGQSVISSSTGSPFRPFSST